MVAVARFRRTLVWHVARCPGGLVALAIRSRHIPPRWTPAPPANTPLANAVLTTNTAPSERSESDVSTAIPEGGPTHPDDSEPLLDNLIPFPRPGS